ncbi:hypothetical protein Tco_0033929 [Tanacetum coccineum]
MTRIDSLEKDLKQTKLTMGSAIVKLVKKVKKLEGILKRRNVVFSDFEEEEPEAQGRKSQDDPLVSLIARKGLHSDKTDEDESEDSKDDDPISGTNIPINPVPVAIKPPSIATYKIIKQGEKGVYQIVREDGTNIVYINFGAMLKDITRDDLTELYRIVINRYGVNGPEDELEKILWEYLKNMFEEPLSTDPVWSSFGQQRIITMLDKKLQGGKLDEDCYKLLKWMEKQAGIRKHKDWLVQEQTALGVNTPGSDENSLKLYDLIADMKDC